MDCDLRNRRGEDTAPYLSGAIFFYIGMFYANFGHSTGHSA
jgi:hypothetical protein